MEIVRKRRASEVAQGFLLLSHPVPVLFHTLAVALFALIAAWPHLVWGTLTLLVAAHTAMQLSIAVLNDYCDRARDMLSKKRKPIPQGLVQPREALIVGLLFIVVMVLLLLPLNPLALLISLLYLLLGQAYNLGLKSTPLSGIVFALAIPLIPLYAFVAVGRILPLLFWLVPLGVLFGISLNLADSLPDIEEDARNKARTLAVVLGRYRTLIACPLLILLGMSEIGILTLTRVVPARPLIIVPTFVLSCLAIGVMFSWVKLSLSIRMSKMYFYLVVLTCLLLVGGWFIGVLS